MEAMVTTGKSASSIIEAKDMKQISDTGALEALVEKSRRRKSEGNRILQSGQAGGPRNDCGMDHEGDQGAGEPDKGE